MKTISGAGEAGATKRFARRAMVLGVANLVSATCFAWIAPGTRDSLFRTVFLVWQMGVPLGLSLLLALYGLHHNPNVVLNEKARVFRFIFHFCIWPSLASPTLPIAIFVVPAFREWLRVTKAARAEACN